MVRIFRYWRSRGFTGIAKNIAYRAYVRELPLWMIELVVLANTTATRSSDRNSKNGTVSFSMAEPKELGDIVTCTIGSDETGLATLFAQFFAAGGRCAVARIDNQVVGYMWGFSNMYTITVDGYRTTNLVVELPDQVVFTGNAYVTPAYRNQGLFQQLKQYCLGQYPPGTSFFTWVNHENSASLAANRRLGFTPIAILKFCRFFGSVRLRIQYPVGAPWRRFGKTFPKLELTRNKLRILFLEAQSKTTR